MEFDWRCAERLLSRRLLLPDAWPEDCGEGGHHLVWDCLSSAGFTCPKLLTGVSGGLPPHPDAHAPDSERSGLRFGLRAKAAPRQASNWDVMASAVPVPAEAAARHTRPTGCRTSCSWWRADEAAPSRADASREGTVSGCTESIASAAMQWKRPDEVRTKRPWVPCKHRCGMYIDLQTSKGCDAWGKKSLRTAALKLHKSYVSGSFICLNVACVVLYFLLSIYCLGGWDSGVARVSPKVSTTSWSHHLGRLVWGTSAFELSRVPWLLSSVSRNVVQMPVFLASHLRFSYILQVDFQKNKPSHQSMMSMISKLGWFVGCDPGIHWRCWTCLEIAIMTLMMTVI